MLFLVVQVAMFNLIILVHLAGVKNNLYWDNVNDYLGIGTKSPGTTLTVSSPNVDVAVFNGTGNNNMELVLNSTTGHTGPFGSYGSLLLGNRSHCAETRTTRQTSWSKHYDRRK